jgi:ketosteroid isomerase-like protein
MRIMRWLFVFSLAVLLHPQELSSQSSEAAIRALEREWTEAQSHNNNRALDLIFDNALVYVEYGKLVSKAEYLSRIRQGIATPDEVAIEPMSVRIFGGTAIVVGSYREMQRKRGQTLIKRWRFIDTWVYEKNGWALVSAGATPIN